MVLKFILYTLCLIYLFVISFTSSTSMHCYNCVQGVDQGCEDPFKAADYSHYSVDCSNAEYRPKSYPDEDRDEFKYGDKAPKGCRKILQEIDGVTHIVRQCAYSGDDVNGMKRTGNKGVRLFYYQCSNQDGCNGAKSLRSDAYRLFAFVSSVLTIVLLYR